MARETVAILMGQNARSAEQAVSWEIRHGDALEQVREMPAESVQCCITSPPYYGLRDYGVPGQIGLEATPDEYVAAIVDVFRGVRHALRADGTVWLNLGELSPAYAEMARRRIVDDAPLLNSVTSADTRSGSLSSAASEQRSAPDAPSDQSPAGIAP